MLRRILPLALALILTALPALGQFNGRGGTNAPAGSSLSLGGGTVSPGPAVTSATTSAATGAAGRLLPIANPTGIVVGQPISGTNIASGSVVSTVSPGTATVTNQTVAIAEPAGGLYVAVANSTGLSIPWFVLDTTTTNALASNTFIAAIGGNASAGVSITGTAGAAAQNVITVSSGGAGCLTGMLAYDTTAAVIPTDSLVLSSTATSVTITNNITGAGVGATDTILCYPSLRLNQVTSNATVAADALTLSPMITSSVQTTGSVASGTKLTLGANTTAVNGSGVSTLGVSNAGGGFQIGGVTYLNALSSASGVPGVLVGPWAGNSLPPPIGAGSVMIGADTGGLITGNDTESVGVGPLALAEMTVGFADTGVGEHVLGYEVSPFYSTGMGNDVMRDVVSTGTNSIFGSQSYEDGGGSSNTVMGALSLHGSAGTIELSVSQHTGDVISVSFTSGNPATVIPTATASYTEQAGDTLATIATGLENAILALGIYYTAPLPPGAPAYNDGIGMWVTADATGTKEFLGIHGPYNMGLIIGSPGCSGTCSGFTATVLAGFTGTDNVVVGTRIMENPGLTTASYNTFVGDYVAGNASIGLTNNVCVGYYCGKSFTIDFENTGAGAYALQSSIDTAGNTAVGFKAGLDITTGGNFNTFLGAFAGDAVTTASYDTVVGENCQPSSNTAGDELDICAGGTFLIEAKGGGTPATATMIIHGSTLALPDIASNTGSQTGSLCWSATTLTYDGTNTCLTSSIRFKRDVQPIHSALAEILRMRPVSFVYKTDPTNDPRFGLIAEDVAKIDTRLVTDDANGEPLKVKYIDLISVLTRAVQQQQDEIYALAAACVLLALWCAGLTVVMLRRRQ